MSKITVAQNQTIFDLALQECGSAEGVFNLLKDNPTVITDLNVMLAPGTKLNIVSAPTDTEVLRYYKDRNIRCASSEKPIIVIGSEDGIAITGEDDAVIRTN